MAATTYGSAITTAAATDSDDGGECGWCCWRPRLLQRLASSKSFLFWICWAGGFQSFLVNGLINVCVSTIEKRYELASTDSGTIIGAFDIASFITVLPVSYLGGRKGACKPRWVGYGVLFLGIGSFVFATPHFLAGIYQAGAEEQVMSMCSFSATALNGTVADCSISEKLSSSLNQDKSRTLQRYKYVFMAAQLIMGAGGAPLYTLGTTFIDDNVSHKMQPIYSGIFTASAMLGPALGYIVGGQLLRIYVDFPTLTANEVGITPASSVWVGAWWMGFVFAAVCLCAVSIPLLAFPGELPGAKQLAAVKEAEEARNALDKVNSKTEADDDELDMANSKPKQDKAVSVKESLRELPAAIKDLLSRWTFLFICMVQSGGAFLIAGLGGFVPKIIENQFGLSPALAATIIGVLVITCGCSGSFLGGYMIKRFRLSPSGILKMIMLWIGLSSLFSIVFIINCPNQTFAGVTAHYSEQMGHEQLRLESTCNSNCSCSTSKYNPVCGVNNVLYYSPCHAGCSASHQTSNGSRILTAYTDCSCIDSSSRMRMALIGGGEVEAMAARQKCALSGCSYQLYLFTGLLFMYLCLTFLNSMPILSATLRCVPSNRRAFALGTQMIIWRLLGAIPGPIVFGYFIDQSCVLWSGNETKCASNKTDNLGSCIVYDNHAFSRSMVGIVLIVEGLKFSFATLAWWFYESPKKPKAAQKDVQDGRVVIPKETYAYDNPVVDRS